MMRVASALLAVLCCLAGTTAAGAENRVRVGSKAFPESWILGEALAILAQSQGEIAVEHARNLGGTEIVYGALRTGEIDIYPEYTGTIVEVLIQDPGASIEEIRHSLAEAGIGMSDPLGFNDSYALAVRKETGLKYQLKRISDLQGHPDLRLSFSHEFLGRRDGYPGLADRYGLDMADVRGIQHDLAYAAIAEGQTDLIDIYTTDAQIARLDLTVLEDDLRFFPRYDAVLLYRLDLPTRAPESFRAMTRLVGTLDEARMIHANAMTVLDGRDAKEAAESLLEEVLSVPVRSAARHGWIAMVAKNTFAHIRLVAISLLAGILLGIPIGILSARTRPLASFILAIAGLFQTIPSLALLAFLIPVLGIGPKPALFALFLYSLLPIVRNTHTGLTTIAPNLVEAAEAIGLSPSAQFRRIYLPMASPAILAGIKTSAIINVGTATLAALIGAGGLGDPILQGIALRDHSLILQGAVPAALLALIIQGGFDFADRLLISPGLRGTPRT